MSIGGLTFSDFARLMRRYEPSRTAAEIDTAWAGWCRKQEQQHQQKESK